MSSWMAHSSGAMLVSGRVTMCNYGWKRCVTRATTKATDHLSIQPSPNSKTKRFTGMLLRKSYKPREDNTPEISQWNSTWTWNTGNLCKHDTLLNTKRPPKTLRLPEFSLFTGRGHMFPQKKHVVYHPRHKSKASFAVSPFKEEDETNQRSLRCEEVVRYHSQTNLSFSLNMNYLKYLHSLLATLHIKETIIPTLIDKYVGIFEIPAINTASRNKLPWYIDEEMHCYTAKIIGQYEITCQPQMTKNPINFQSSQLMIPLRSLLLNLIP